MSDLPNTVTTDADSFPGLPEPVSDTCSEDRGDNDSCSSIVSPDAEPCESGDVSSLPQCPATGSASIDLRPLSSTRDGNVLDVVQEQLRHRVTKAIDGNITSGQSSSKVRPSIPFFSGSSTSSPVEEVTDKDVVSLKMEMPTELKIDYQDAMILYCEEDRNRVTDFIEAFQDIVLDGRDSPMVVLYDEIAISIGSKLKALEFGLDRSTYIFLFVTEPFCKDSWSEFSSETCLMEAIHNEDKKWCVVPVFTQPKRNAKFKVPPSLNSLKGIQYWSNDKFFRDSVQRLLEDKLHVRKNNEKQLLNKRKQWVTKYRIRKIEEATRELQDNVHRQQQEVDARQSQLNLQKVLKLIQSGNQSPGKVESMMHEFYQRFGVKLNSDHIGIAQQEHQQCYPNQQCHHGQYETGDQQHEAGDQQHASAVDVHRQCHPAQEAWSHPPCQKQSMQPNPELFQTGPLTDGQLTTGPPAGSRPPDSISCLPHQSSNRAAAANLSGQDVQTTARETNRTSSKAQTPTTTRSSSTLSPASLEPDCDRNSLLSAQSSFGAPLDPPGHPLMQDTATNTVTTESVTVPKSHKTGSDVKLKHIHYHYHYPNRHENDQEQQPINIVGAQFVQIGGNNMLTVAGQSDVLGDEEKDTGNADSSQPVPPTGNDDSSQPVPPTGNADSSQPVPPTVQQKESVAARCNPPASTIFQDNSASVANRQPAPAARPVPLPTRSQTSDSTAVVAAIIPSFGSLPSSEVDPPGSRQNPGYPTVPDSPGQSHAEVPYGIRASANLEALSRQRDQTSPKHLMMGGGDALQMKQQQQVVVPAVQGQRRAPGAAAQNLPDRYETLPKEDADVISEQTLAKIRAIESEID